MNERMPHEAPDYRAALADDRLTLIPWSPALVRCCGPASRLLRDGLPSLLADITVVRDNNLMPSELIVSEFASDSRQCLRRALIDWASVLGYERIWFNDAVVQLDRGAAVAGKLASTGCTTCGSQWSDASPEFWIGAQRSGVFPLFCPVCGHPLPQWSVPDASCAAWSCSVADASSDVAKIAADFPSGRPQ